MTQGRSRGKSGGRNRQKEKMNILNGTILVSLISLAREHRA